MALHLSSLTRSPDESTLTAGWMALLEVDLVPNSATIWESREFKQAVEAYKSAAAYSQYRYTRIGSVRFVFFLKKIIGSVLVCIPQI